ncbi:DNA-3-methyladenine glycosylase I [Sphingobacterium sp. HJSM2_6]|uniref:DNA-3-methyladenine glycosylase I n=1 Tax=Sphingobacterium sp. HJSM2_6 TaxID=3366264 RepID=UPI003BCC05B6
MSRKEIIRCGWCSNDEQYQKYHDHEWGKQVKDDQILFEFLILESAQAGLSWITILRKRENYRKAFADFDYKKVAKFSEEDMLQLLENPGIVRNKLKIASAIHNAKIFMQIQQDYGSFYTYLYSFLPNQQAIINNFELLKQVPAQTELSILLAKDLKKKGMKFFGPTTCYAFMQAVGMVNDHVLTCSYR